MSAICPKAEWDRVQGVMLRGVYLCMKYELPHLLETGGAIVNTASGAGLVGYPGQSPYVSSKHGVLGLTKSAALEYGTPGRARQRRVPRHGAHPDGGGRHAAARPRGRSWSPSTRSAASARPRRSPTRCMWLCSDDASFVLGHALCRRRGLRRPVTEGLASFLDEG